MKVLSGLAKILGFRFSASSRGQLHGLRLATFLAAENLLNSSMYIQKNVDFNQNLLKAWFLSFFRLSLKGQCLLEVCLNYTLNVKFLFSRILKEKVYIISSMGELHNLQPMK